MIVRNVMPLLSRNESRPRINGSSPIGTMTSKRPTDFRPEKSGRRDTDDRERHVVEPQPAADDVSSASESPLPEAVADHGHRTFRAAARSVVGVREGATQHCRHAERLEERSARP